MRRDQPLCRMYNPVSNGKYCYTAASLSTVQALVLGRQLIRIYVEAAGAADTILTGSVCCVSDTHDQAGHR